MVLPVTLPYCHQSLPAGWHTHLQVRGGQCYHLDEGQEQLDDGQKQLDEGQEKGNSTS